MTHVYLIDQTADKFLSEFMQSIHKKVILNQNSGLTRELSYQNMSAAESCYSRRFLGIFHSEYRLGPHTGDIGTSVYFHTI